MIRKIERRTINAPLVRHGVVSVGKRQDVHSRCWHVSKVLLCALNNPEQSSTSKLRRRVHPPAKRRAKGAGTSEVGRRINAATKGCPERAGTGKLRRRIDAAAECRLERTGTGK